MLFWGLVKWFVQTAEKPLSSIAFGDETRERVRLLCEALSYPVRYEIVEFLSCCERNTHEIATALEISQSVASRHLNVLLRAGLLAVEPGDGRLNYRLRGPEIASILKLAGETGEIDPFRTESDPTEEGSG